MVTVYLAEDLKHGRKVALKVLKPALAAVVRRSLGHLVGHVAPRRPDLRRRNARAVDDSVYRRRSDAPPPG